MTTWYLCLSPNWYPLDVDVDVDLDPNISGQFPIEKTGLFHLLCGSTEVILSAGNCFPITAPNECILLSG